ncbi:hypothetical protein DYE50_10480 [Treponema ruminis]|uniref:Uncharacterized protein n=1 Tax=Treponema ruminis TaxID=744515 RepID=A0A7W8G9B3_9SPIR|nr:hypothetical protein [Treponema ruminis]MBB5226101.1 hypothetical protein [Treponema ruminis]QSI02990.1 hypothetical protein DYE50_10480 [Treponema ruminis]
MSSGQKVAFSLLISVLAFCAFTVVAFSGLFDILEVNFYQPIVQEIKQKKIEEIAAAQNEYFETLMKRFDAFSLAPSVKTYMDSHPSDASAKNRETLRSQLVTSTPALTGIRIIGENGRNLFYSTFPSDKISGSKGISYRNYDTSGEIDYDSVSSRKLADGSSPADKKCRIIKDGNASQIIFSFPFYNSENEYSGSILFYCDPVNFSHFLYNRNLIDIKGFASLLTELPQAGKTFAGFGGFVFGLPNYGQSSIRQEILKKWRAGGENFWKINADDNSDSNILDESKNNSLCAFSYKSPREDLGFITFLYDESELKFPPYIRILLLATAFVTLYLAIFLILSFKHDDIVVIRDKIRRYENEFFISYQKMGDEKSEAYLAEQKPVLERRILKSLGKKGEKHAAEFKSIFESYWQEMLASFGENPLRAIGGAMPAAAIDADELKKIVRSSLEDILENGKIQINAVQVKEASHEAASQPKNISNEQLAISKDEAAEPEELEEVEALDDVEEIESVEEIEDAESVEEVAEAEDVEELSDVEEVADAEPAEPEELDEVEALDEVEDVESVEEIEDAEAVEDVEDVESVEEIEDAESVEEVAEAEPAEPEELEDVEALDDAEEAESVEEIEEAEVVEEVSEAEDVEELSDVEEVTDAEPDEPEELEDVETLDEVEEIEDAEAVEEVEDAESVEEIPEAEDVEELSDVEEVADAEPDEPEELEDVETLDEVEDVESVEEIEEAEALEDLDEAEPAELDDAEEVEALEEVPETEAADTEARISEELEPITDFNEELRFGDGRSEIDDSTPTKFSTVTEEDLKHKFEEELEMLPEVSEKEERDVDMAKTLAALPERAPRWTDNDDVELDSSGLSRKLSASEMHDIEKLKEVALAIDASDNELEELEVFDPTQKKDDTETLDADFYLPHLMDNNVDPDDDIYKDESLLEKIEFGVPTSEIFFEETDDSVADNFVAAPVDYSFLDEDDSDEKMYEEEAQTDITESGHFFENVELLNLEKRAEENADDSAELLEELEADELEAEEVEAEAIELEELEAEELEPEEIEAEELEPETLEEVADQKNEKIDEINEEFLNDSDENADNQDYPAIEELDDDSDVEDLEELEKNMPFMFTQFASNSNTQLAELVDIPDAIVQDSDGTFHVTEMPKSDSRISLNMEFKRLVDSILY